MRLIDIDYYCKNICLCTTRECDKIKCVLLNAPTIDAVKVVRCKDCAYFNSKKGCYDYCELLISPISPDDFCSMEWRNLKWRVIAINDCIYDETEGKSLNKCPVEAGRLFFRF